MPPRRAETPQSAVSSVSVAPAPVRTRARSSNPTRPARAPPPEGASSAVSSSRSRGPVLEPNDGEAQLAVGYEAEHVHGGSRLLEPRRSSRPPSCQRDAAPLRRSRRSRAPPARVTDREAAVTAIADDLERHSLVDGAHRARIDEERVVGVAVDVDEAGRNVATGGIEVRLAPGSTSPILSIRPPARATSARSGSAPVPSSTVPLRMTSVCPEPLTRTQGARSREGDAAAPPLLLLVDQQRVASRARRRRASARRRC